MGDPCSGTITLVTCHYVMLRLFGIASYNALSVIHLASVL